MADYKFFVLLGVNEGQEEAFDTWYDDQHLPDVLAVPGVVSASRFRVLNRDTPGPSATFYSVAIYELSTEDPDAVAAEIFARAGTDAMPLSDSIDMNAVGQLLTLQTRSLP